MMQLRTNQGFDEHAALTERSGYCGECGYNYYTCDCPNETEADDVND